MSHSFMQDMDRNWGVDSVSNYRVQYIWYNMMESVGSHRVQFSLNQFGLLNEFLQYDIPAGWSINKVKCLLDNEIHNLKFDAMELACQGQILKGETKVGQLITTLHNSPHYSHQNNQHTITLAILIRKSQITLSEYYKQKIGVFLKRSEHEHQPVLSEAAASLTNQDPQSYVKLEQPEKYIQHYKLIKKVENRNAFINLNTYCQLVHGIVFVLLACAFMKHGTWYQIIQFWLFVVICLSIECRIAYTRIFNSIQLISDFRRMRYMPKNYMNTHVTPQSPSGTQTQASGSILNWAIFCLYISVSMLKIFFLSLTPNWTISKYLQIQQNNLNKRRDQINESMPGTYTTKITIKESYSNRILEQQLL